jgi:hypothetical protein
VQIEETEEKVARGKGAKGKEGAKKKGGGGGVCFTFCGQRPTTLPSCKSKSEPGSICDLQIGTAPCMS